MSFFSELKRRNVFRVALLYVIASWLILEVADASLSLLNLPPWAGWFIFLLLAVSFPLVLVFAWVYELTPEGLKKESTVDRSQSIVHRTAIKLNAAVILLFLLALAGMVIHRFLPEEPIAADLKQPSQTERR